MTGPILDQLGQHRAQILGHLDKLAQVRLHAWVRIRAAVQLYLAEQREPKVRAEQAARYAKAAKLLRRAAALTADGLAFVPAQLDDMIRGADKVASFLKATGRQRGEHSSGHHQLIGHLAAVYRDAEGKDDPVAFVDDVLNAIGIVLKEETIADYVRRSSPKIT